eukprot:gene34998-44853_t
MAIATIAYTAAAGAMALALSTTWLAWRNRTRFTQNRDVLSTELGLKDTMLNELDAATQAFEEAFLAIEGDAVRLVWGEDTLKHCAEALGLMPDVIAAKDCAPQVVEALGETSTDAARSLKALIAEGHPCRFEIFAEAPPKALQNSNPGLTLI